MQADALQIYSPDHPPPSDLYSATTSVRIAVWLWASASSLPNSSRCASKTVRKSARPRVYSSSAIRSAWLLASTAVASFCRRSCSRPWLESASSVSRKAWSSRLIPGLRLFELLFASGDVAANAPGFKDRHGNAGPDREKISCADCEAGEIRRLAAYGSCQSDLRKQVGFGSAHACRRRNQIHSRFAQIRPAFQKVGGQADRHNSMFVKGEDDSKTPTSFTRWSFISKTSPVRNPPRSSRTFLLDRKRSVHCLCLRTKSFSSEAFTSDMAQYVIPDWVQWTML